MISVPATIPRVARITGVETEAGRAIGAALLDAGFAICLHDAPAAAPVGVLVTGQVDASAATAAMRKLAEALPPGAEGAVFTILGASRPSVAATIDRAALVAATQAMALSLAPRVRVNAVGPGAPAAIAATVLLLLRLPSATGQVVAVDAEGRGA